MQTGIIDEQVIAILKQLRPLQNWRQSITASIGELLGENDLQERLTKIRRIIERTDTRWDHGFITDEQEYLRQRIELQQELERLTPVENNDLERAVDLLDNFPKYWDGCGEELEAQSEPVGRIVERIYVEDGKVVAMTLRSNCHLVLGHKINGPTEYTVDPFVENQIYQCGSDGI